MMITKKSIIRRITSKIYIFSKSNEIFKLRRPNDDVKELSLKVAAIQYKCNTVIPAGVERGWRLSRVQKCTKIGTIVEGKA